MIESWVASNKPRLSICLGFDDDNTPGKMAIISDANYDRVEAAYEELGAPGQLKGKREAKTISYADLLGISAEEFALQNLHVAEWTSSEGSPTDSLLAQGENTLTEVDSIHLPLDKITQSCREEDTHCCIQVLITPRNGKRVKNSFNLKRQGKPTNEHTRVLNLLLDGIFPEDNSSNDTNQKTHLTERQLEKFASFDTEYTFNIQVQAVVYDSQSGHSEHAESIFNTVDAAVGVAMKNTIKRTVPTSEAGKQELLKKIVTQKPSQSSKLSNLTSLRFWKRTLSFWTNRQAIVTDSNRVWTFALLSTKTGDGQSWIHDTPTRDQQPTDLPPEENLDQFRANDDDKN
jgi:hypothetical protein